MQGLNPKHLALLQSMQPFVADNLHFLGQIEKVWQPTDYLPDLTAEDWRDQVE